jgi:hypothetical protein
VGGRGGGGIQATGIQTLSQVAMCKHLAGIFQPFHTLHTVKKDADPLSLIFFFWFCFL